MDRFLHDGVGLAYLDQPPPAGHGHPVLLIHGFASNHRVNWVGPSWFKTLGDAGYRVIALDNRGHGQSTALYDPAAYHSAIMAEDARALLDHLGVGTAFVVGYSMGARIAAFLALNHPARVDGLVLGGLGIHLVDGAGLPDGLAEALEGPSLAAIENGTARMFRAFAEQNGGDLAALAACMRGSRQAMSREDVARILTPTMVAVGTADPIAGAPEPLAALMPKARALPLSGRDHNLAVGDRQFRAEAVRFFDGLRAAGGA